MRRKLTISKLKNKPFIRIYAKYLRRFGFNEGDVIDVRLSECRIEIRKMKSNKPIEISLPLK